MPQRIVRRRITVHEYLDGTYDIDELDLAPRKEHPRRVRLAPAKAADELARMVELGPLLR